ncbi:hypothetical protein [uncultured Brevundimonas sp.]|uniref:hypothetical protein n=1 Tax=uncultured Brevundimonas sp. TaxID=213418 RepID=UPI0025FC9B6E|nr:hypothetical protein [uncultured Brevundimonas sp.]
MRLLFQVLWFENQAKEVAAQAQALRSALSDHGFDLKIDMKADGSEVEELGALQEKFHEYDLVVVDFDLGNDELQGDLVAKQIRTKFGFTDIIFYSGSKPDELRQKVKDRAIDGVYCMSRTDLRVGLIEHVEEVVKRLSRLEAMRGLAVAAAGKGDDHLKEIIRALYVAADEEGQAAICSLIDHEVGGLSKRLADKYGEAEDLEQKMRAHGCSSVILWKVTKALLKGNSALGVHHALLRKYQDEVMNPRNLLGHVVETRTEDGWKIEHSAGDPLVLDDFPKIRKNFSGQLKNLEAIVGLLVPAADR